MLDGVLHNAALRMEADGIGLDDVLSPKGAIRRWVGRGGAAVGGAASLAVGAILGGAFEGIPVLLPPPAAAAVPAAAVPGLPADTPLQLAAGLTSFPGLPQLPAQVPAPVTAGVGQAQQVVSTVTQTVQGGSGTGATQLGPVNTITSGGGGGGVVNTGGAGAPSGGPSGGGSGGGSNPLGPVAGPVSSIPVVGPVVGGVVNTVG
jgi:hypothetical protein